VKKIENEDFECTLANINLEMVTGTAFYVNSFTIKSFHVQTSFLLGCLLMVKSLEQKHFPLKNFFCFNTFSW
jgi:hypothetical protein